MGKSGNFFILNRNFPLLCRILLGQAILQKISIKGGLFMAKKKNIRQQLNNVIHKQFQRATGKSRHQEKQRTESNFVPDMIFSRNSQETHLR